MKNNTVNAKSHKRGLRNIIRSVVGASILTVVMSASASHDGDTAQMECEPLLSLTQQGLVVYMTNSGLLAEDGSGPKEGLSNEQAEDVQYIAETYLDANPACLDMSAMAWVDYAAGMNQEEADSDDAETAAPIPADADAGEAPEMFDACTEQHGPEGQQFCNDPAFCGDAEFCGSCAYNAENDHCYTDDFASEVAA